MERKSSDATVVPPPEPVFDAEFRSRFAELVAWRRDVRRFSDRAVPEALLDELLDVAQSAPSVGNSQPWRWVRVATDAARAEIRANFVACNALAAAAQPSERRERYRSLKLEGLDRAPAQFAVFCDPSTEQGYGLGVRSMPEMLAYSTVAMVSTFWLAARAAGVGVGWISILDPQRVAQTLRTPEPWKLVAYLCVGWPETAHLDPELERYGWQSRTKESREILTV